MDFESTSTFNSDLALLTKKKTSGYHSVKEDIKASFNGRAFSDIFQMHCIRNIGQSRLIKIRIPISCSSTGARGGFRLILVANPNTQKVYLCHLYPKKGVHGKENASAEKIAIILEELSVEVNQKSTAKISWLADPKPKEKVTAQLTSLEKKANN